MNTEGVVVVFEGATGEPYQIGKATKATDEGSVPVEIIHREQDRAAAFDKARLLADGHDVFFSQHGRPGVLQDFYNYTRCPKCQTLVQRFTEKILAAAPRTPLRSCPVCGQMIDGPAIL